MTDVLRGYVYVAGLAKKYGLEQYLDRPAELIPIAETRNRVRRKT